MGGRGSSGGGGKSFDKNFNKLNTQVQLNSGKTLDQLRQGLRDEYSKISGGTNQQYQSLVKVAEAKGYKVVENTNIPGNGRISYDTKTITVNSNLNTSQKIKTLAHELGHEVLHKNTNKSLGQVEAEAEAVSKMMTDKFGMSNESSKYYVSGYMQKEGIPASKFESYKGDVQKAYDDINSYMK